MENTFFILISLSVLCGLAMLITAYILSPKINSQIKKTTYECGIKSISDDNSYANIKFISFIFVFFIYELLCVLIIPIIIVCARNDILALSLGILYIIFSLLGIIFSVNTNLLRFK